MTTIKSSKLFPAVMFKAFVLVLVIASPYVVSTFQPPIRMQQRAQRWPNLSLNHCQHRLFEVLTLSSSKRNNHDLEEIQPNTRSLNTFQRREFIQLASFSAAVASLFFPQPLPIGSSSSSISSVANAVVMSNDSVDASVFQAGQALGPQRAKARFVQAKQSLQYLIDHYDEIVAQGGGDNVRRYLGTVGVSSGLYGIPKVLKELQEEAKDIVEFTENMNEFDFSLRAADTAVYSANFVEFSAAKTKPEKFFEDARLESERMMVYMDAMAAELDL
jgi:hypothetical protein